MYDLQRAYKVKFKGSNLNICIKKVFNKMEQKIYKLAPSTCELGQFYVRAV